MTVRQVVDRLIPLVDPDDDAFVEALRMAGDGQQQERWDDCEDRRSCLAELFESTLSPQQRALWKAIRDAELEVREHEAAWAARRTIRALEAGLDVGKLAAPLASE